MSIHPPTQPLELLPTSSEPGTTPLFTATYMEMPHRSQNKDPVLVQDLVPIMKQHNYTNLFFQTLGKQMTRIEETVNHIKDSCHLQPKTELKSEVIPVSIKPPLEVTKFKLSSTKKDT